MDMYGVQEGPCMSTNLLRGCLIQKNPQVLVKRTQKNLQCIFGPKCVYVCWDWGTFVLGDLISPLSLSSHVLEGLLRVKQLGVLS